jgi:UDP-N-acetylmuramoyl-tripeptide--D-alanyl-D-alanine ligase
VGDAPAAPPLWTSHDIVRATGGTLHGEAFAAAGLDIDSRELAPGDLFVALTAARDGHAFAGSARGRGAVATLASAPVTPPYVLVGDTLAGLRALAAAARDRAVHARRGAITGSVGKTSVTQAVLAALRRAGEAHGSVRSFNNHIGVPLTLARMPPATRTAIFEMGMNHAGEIAPLSRLVRPHAVAVTTVEAVHVENFAAGEAGVAAAKAEILEGLEPGGAAILNADNRWFETLALAARDRGATVRAFGRAQGAQARLLGFEARPGGARVEARIDGADVAYALRQSAPHWGPMSLCAILMIRELGVDLPTALAALADFAPLAGRGAEATLIVPGGDFTLIDDSYNASPVSVAAALRALGAREARGRRIAVLTDMLELGPDAPALHAGLAPVAEAARIDALFCAGPLMRHLYEAIAPTRRGGYAEAAEGLIADLASAIGPGDVVMIKGSHASRAGDIVAALTGSHRAAPDDR